MTTTSRHLTVAALLVLSALLPLLPASEAAETEPPLEATYFGADGCPFCAQMEPFLDALEAEHGDMFVLTRYEISQDPAAQQRWEAEVRSRGQEPSGVPTLIVGERIWVGYNDQIAQQINDHVAGNVPVGAVERPAPQPEEGEMLAVPLLGEVDLAAQNTVLTTVLIAFVDGFNPCSLWVLAVLLAMVLNAGLGRRRIAAVGITFLVVTGAIYGLFIVGVFSILTFITQLDAIRAGVAAFAFVVGAINIKDYVAYKRGISLTIPDRFKPKIYRGGRTIRRADHNLAVMLGATVALAAGVAVIELPCTAGFPVVWSGILRSQGLDTGPEFAALLGLYLLVYVGLELLLFFTAVITLKAARFEERQGRWLKLVGGSVMVAIGAAMFAAPAMLETVSGLVGLMLLAVVITFVVAGVNGVVGRVRSR